MEVSVGTVIFANWSTTIRASATVTLSTTFTLEKIASACEKKKKKKKNKKKKKQNKKKRKKKNKKKKKSKIQQELTIITEPFRSHLQ